MHIKTFLSENIYFGSYNKHALVTTFLNNSGNLFLSPIRHLLQGRTATCVVMPSDRKYKQVLFGDVNDKHPHGIERFLKTTISIVLFIPCTILGAAIKGTAFLISSNLRKKYEALNGMKDLMRSSQFKTASDVAICLYEEDAGRLFSILKKLKEMNQLDSFIKYFYEVKEPNNTNGNLAFLDGYPNLYLSTEEERIRNPSLECVIGCLLKLYADNKIPISEFFSKMDLIDNFASEKPVDQNTLGASMKFVPIQNVIKLDDNLEMMVIAVEKYLKDKGIIETS